MNSTTPCPCIVIITDHLCQYEFHDRWVEATNEEKPARRWKSLRDICGELPEVDQLVLHHILKLLHRCHKRQRLTLMGAEKLAGIWGAVLLRQPGFQDKKGDNVGHAALHTILREFQARPESSGDLLAMPTPSPKLVTELHPSTHVHRRFGLR